MKRLILILALGVLLLPSMPAIADVPANVDLFWMWNWTPQYDPATPIQFFVVNNAYGLPPDALPQWETNRLRIPNRPDRGSVKTVWWEVKWGNMPLDDAWIDMVRLEAPGATGDYVVSPGRPEAFWKSGPQGGERIWTWKWEIRPQPEVEWIVFDPQVFRLFSNPQGLSVFEIEVGSSCVPVPEATTVMLSLLGLSSVAGFRRLRFK